jgi:DNA repair protein RecN (Recombination protein N)
MLRELRIRNFAIIEDLALTFGEGLNVLTGETGVGKSVILKALMLLCGERAGPDLIRSDATAAVIDGLFEGGLTRESAEPFGLTPGDEVLVRRELLRSGKGRIHVNGSPATAVLLGRLGEQLVHVYGQHDQALLLRPASHLEFLDRFGDLTGLSARMRDSHRALADARQRLEQIDARLSAKSAREELLRSQIEELAGTRLRADEEADLRQQRERIRHAERILRLCQEAETTLYSGDGAIVSEITRLVARLSDLHALVPALVASTDLIETACVQLEEAARDIAAAASDVQFDPSRLDQIEERLALLNRLSRKYELPSAELPALLARLEAEQAELETQEGERTGALAATIEREREALAVAGEISAARKQAAVRLEAEMQRELAVLGMPGAVFRVVFDEPTGAAEPVVSPAGIDRIEFHLSANPGEMPLPLARIASGGELSRIMLALKALTASNLGTSVLIFDEVDAGIGGAVADAVGQRLRRLAAARQVLCITHLPQIAAYADRHYCVEKQSRHGRTVAEARHLAPRERVQEISRMLGGTVAPAEAERYARRLVAQGQRLATQPRR